MQRWLGVSVVAVLAGACGGSGSPGNNHLGDAGMGGTGGIGGSGGTGGGGMGGGGGTGGTGGGGMGGGGGTGGTGGTGGSGGSLVDHCLVGGDVLYAEGTGYLYDGTVNVMRGVWSVTSQPSDLMITLYPWDLSQGERWDFDFSSTQLQMPLSVGTYANAMRAPFATPGHPGIDISTDSRGCNMEAGSFQIDTFNRAGTAVNAVTLTFDQICDVSSNHLQGCIHYEAGAGGSGGSGGSGGTGGSGGGIMNVDQLLAHCSGTADVLYAEGTGYLYNGTETVTQGAWNAQASAQDVMLTLYPQNVSQGTQWNFEFSSQRLALPLAVGLYDNAMRAPFATPGHPGIDISIDSRGCNNENGAFQVTDWGLSGTTLQRFTVAFDEFCDASSHLRGCIHYQSP